MGLKRMVRRLANALALSIGVAIIALSLLGLLSTGYVAAQAILYGIAGTPDPHVVTVQGITNGFGLPVTGGLAQGAAAGSAPTNLISGVASANNTAIITCDNSQNYDATTNGSTQLVGLVSGKTIYICGFELWWGGTSTVELDYGTGSNCGTGNTKIAGAWAGVAQNGITDPSPFYRGFHTAASNALCIKTNAAVQVVARVYYTQY